MERRRLNLVASAGNLTRQHEDEEPLGLMSASIEAFMPQFSNGPDESRRQSEPSYGHISIARRSREFHPSSDRRHVESSTLARRIAPTPNDISRTRRTPDADQELRRVPKLRHQKLFENPDQAHIDEESDHDDDDAQSDPSEDPNAPHIAFVQRPGSNDQVRRWESVALSAAIQATPHFPINAEVRAVDQIQKVGDTGMHILDNGHRLGGLACKECKKIMKVVEVSGAGFAVCDMATCLNCDGYRPVVIGIDETNSQATCFDCTQILKDEIDLLFCPKRMLRDRQRRRTTRHGHQSVMRNKPLPRTPSNSAFNPFEYNPESSKSKATLRSKLKSTVLDPMSQSNKRANAKAITMGPRRAETSTPTAQLSQPLPITGKKNKIKRFFNLGERGDAEVRVASLRANTAMMDVGGSAAFPTGYR